MPKQKTSLLKNLTFDGNYTNQHVFNNEHSGGIIIDESDTINIENCMFINTSGDGIGIRGVNHSSSNVTIQNCFFDNNQREGITLGSGFKNITINNCFFGKIFCMMLYIQNQIKAIFGKCID